MATSADRDLDCGVVASGDSGGSGTIRLQCWADFALSDGASGADLKPRGRKARALVAYLALHPGKSVSRERLAGLLWGDRAEPQARASLRQAITELRPLANGGRNALVVEQESLRLRPGAVTTDIAEIERAAAGEDFAGLIALLPEPDERLFANLDGVNEDFDDWLAIERTRQRDALLSLVADAAAAARAQGHLREARALQGRMKEIDPGAALAMPMEDRVARAGHPEIAATRANPVRDAIQRWRVAALVAILLTFSVLAAAAWQFPRERPNDRVAVAVLPFRDLSGTGQGHFAEGVSEEILGQLARNPQLRVSGRTSAWSFKGKDLDAPALGRELGVSYLVEGSVRSLGERVRVDVALVRARDGSQIWSERMDGSIDDLFAIQDRIGNAVSARLAGGVTSPARSIANPRGEAYALYLTARGLFRMRKLNEMRTAIGLLRQAVRIDPSFALAWAQLGGAISIEQSMAAQGGSFDDRPSDGGEAERLVRHALRLQPNLPEGHAMLGLVLGYNSTEARAHLKRAVELDPRDPQKLFWLSHALGAEGDYPGRLNALRRAVAIDPTWHRTALQAGVAAWEMGYRQEGERYAARVPRSEMFLACAVDFHMGGVSGDYSRIAKTSAAARLALGDSKPSTRNLGFVALLLGQGGPARQLLQMPDAFWPLALDGAVPDPATMDMLNRAGEVDGDSIPVLELAVRRLLNARAGDDIVRLYDGRDGVLSASRDWDSPALLRHGPNVALALRQVGRHAESAKLLERIDASIRRSMRLGPVPNWYLAGAAQAWSVAGKRGAALAALERATVMGWHYVSWTPNSDIADLPAFAPLRGDPRFERVRANLRAHIERERREAGPIIV